jgi:hypothetical protein
VSPNPSTVARLLVKKTVMRYDTGVPAGFDADPFASQPPGTTAHELIATKRRKSTTLGTELGTEVAEVCGIVVVVAPVDCACEGADVVVAPPELVAGPGELQPPSKPRLITATAATTGRGGVKSAFSVSLPARRERLRARGGWLRPQGAARAARP